MAIPDEPFDSAEYLAGLPTVRRQTPEESHPVALFLAGGPFAGKTTVLNKLLSESNEFIPRDAVIVDPAEIRTLLPEWGQLHAEGDPRAAAMVRAEAIDIARRIFQETVYRGLNVIVKGIGAGEAGAFAALLRRTQTAGYEVRVLLVDAPTAIALERAKASAQQIGLEFDANTIDRLHSECSLRFQEWSQVEGLRWEMFSTD